jgi:hypothetical protein
VPANRKYADSCAWLTKYCIQNYSTVYSWGLFMEQNVPFNMHRVVCMIMRAVSQVF